MRITLVISSLSSGGAERVMSIMANYWAARAKKVTLITFAAESTDFYVLHPEVKRVALGLTAISRYPWEALRNNLRRLKRLRQEIRTSDPDVVISFIDWTNVSTLLAGLGLNKPVIVSIRTDPRQHHIGWMWSALRRLLYPRAQAVVVQSDEVRRWTQRFIRKEMIHTIPNPVALPAHGPNNALGYSSPPGRTVIAMGRLGPEKGYDLLVRAFARCAAKYPGWSLVILGEGEERGRLEALADELGIADRVSMPGQIVGPTELLRQADLFVLSSRFEGFPNALLEAMACGLPVVSTDCPSGPREIIRDGVDGVLVAPEDVGTLAAAMGRLMSDEAERKRLASRAMEVTERFSLKMVMGIWEDVLDEIVERRRGMSKDLMDAASGEKLEGHTEKMRKAEVEALKPWFSPGARVLELGGGSGYQASIIASWGCDITSIDVADRPDLVQTLYYPVQDYDGVNIPYADESFDVVFSDAVLPCVKALPLVLAETRRVLKPEGLAIHIVPSRTWRLWTTLSHPIWLFKLLLCKLLLWRPRSGVSNNVVKAPSATGDSDEPGLFFRVKQVLFPGPPTEHANTLSEFYYWNKAHWLALFEKNGFEVKQISNNGLFYTGKALMPGLPLRTRRVLARFLGATQHIFIMRKSKA